MNLYQAVLSNFKTFLLTFEKKEPLVHKLYDDQISLLKWFLTCFVKFEEINKSKDILTLDVKDTAVHLRKRDLYIGNQATQILRATPASDSLKMEFRCTLKEAYVSTAVYMQSKLKASDVVKSLSAIDPKTLGHTLTFQELSKLGNCFHSFLTDEENSQYYREIRAIQVDDQLPQVCDQSGATRRLDHWWSEVFSSGKYPALSKLVKACLNIFTAPQFEQSFSFMNDCINPKTNRLDIRTFSAIQLSGMT